MTRQFWFNYGLPLTIIACTAFIWLLGRWYLDREQRAIDALMEAEKAASRDAERST